MIGADRAAELQDFPLERQSRDSRRSSTHAAFDTHIGSTSRLPQARRINFVQSVEALRASMQSKDSRTFDPILQAGLQSGLSGSQHHAREFVGSNQQGLGKPPAPPRSSHQAPWHTFHSAFRADAAASSGQSTPLVGTIPPPSSPFVTPLKSSHTGTAEALTHARGSPLRMADLGMSPQLRRDLKGVLQRGLDSPSASDTLRTTAPHSIVPPSLPQPDSALLAPPAVPSTSAGGPLVLGTAQWRKEHGTKRLASMKRSIEEARRHRLQSTFDAWLAAAHTLRSRRVGMTLAATHRRSQLLARSLRGLRAALCRARPAPLVHPAQARCLFVWICSALPDSALVASGGVGDTPASLLRAADAQGHGRWWPRWAITAEALAEGRVLARPPSTGSESQWLAGALALASTADSDKDALAGYSSVRHAARTIRHAATAASHSRAGRSSPDSLTWGDSDDSESGQPAGGGLSGLHASSIAGSVRAASGNPAGMTPARAQKLHAARLAAREMQLVAQSRAEAALPLARGVRHLRVEVLTRIQPSLKGHHAMFRLQRATALWDAKVLTEVFRAWRAMRSIGKAARLLSGTAITRRTFSKWRAASRAQRQIQLGVPEMQQRVAQRNTRQVFGAWAHAFRLRRAYRVVLRKSNDSCLTRVWGAWRDHHRAQVQHRLQAAKDVQTRTILNIKTRCIAAWHGLMTQRLKARSTATAVLLLQQAASALRKRRAFLALRQKCASDRHQREKAANIVSRRQASRAIARWRKWKQTQIRLRACADKFLSGLKAVKQQRAIVQWQGVASKRRRLRAVALKVANRWAHRKAASAVDTWADWSHSRAHRRNIFGVVVANWKGNQAARAVRQWRSFTQGAKRTRLAMTRALDLWQGGTLKACWRRWRLQVQRTREAEARGDKAEMQLQILRVRRSLHFWRVDASRSAALKRVASGVLSAWMGVTVQGMFKALAENAQLDEGSKVRAATHRVVLHKLRMHQALRTWSSAARLRVRWKAVLSQFQQHLCAATAAGTRALARDLLQRWRSHSLEKKCADERFQAAVRAIWKLRAGAALNRWAAVNRERRILQTCALRWRSHEKLRAVNRWTFWLQQRKAARSILAQCVSRWSNRRAIVGVQAWAAFAAQRRRKRQQVADAVALMRTAGLRRAWNSLVENLQESRAANARMLAVVKRWQHSRTAASLQRWSQVTQSRKATKQRLLRSVQVLRNSGKHKALQQWRSWSTARQHKRAVMQKALHRWQNRNVCVALQLWRERSQEAIHTRQHLRKTVLVWQNASAVRALRTWAHASAQRAAKRRAAELVARRWRNKSVFAALHRWHEAAVMRRSNRARLAYVLRQWQMRQTASCVRQWQNHTAEARKHRQLMVKAAHVFSQTPLQRMLLRWRYVSRSRSDMRRALSTCVLRWQHHKAAGAIRTWAARASDRRRKHQKLAQAVQRFRMPRAVAAIGTWHEYAQDAIRRRNLLKRSVQFWQLSKVGAAVRAWHAHTQDVMRQRQLLRRAAFMWTNASALRAVRAWADAAQASKRRQTLLRKSISAWQHQNVCKFLRLWRDNAATRAHNRKALLACVRRWQAQKVCRALDRWHDTAQCRIQARDSLSSAITVWKMAKVSHFLRAWRDNAQLRVYRRLLMQRAVQRWSQVRHFAAIQAWREFAQGRKRRRNLAHKVVHTLQNARLRSAVLCWNSHVERRRARHGAMFAVLRKWRNHSKCRALGAWRTWTASRKQHRTVISTVLQRVVSGKIHRALAKWREMAATRKANRQQLRAVLARWRSKSLLRVFYAWCEFTDTSLLARECTVSIPLPLQATLLDTARTGTPAAVLQEAGFKPGCAHIAQLEQAEAEAEAAARGGEHTDVDGPAAAIGWGELAAELDEEAVTELQGAFQAYALGLTRAAAPSATAVLPTSAPGTPLPDGSVLRRGTGVGMYFDQFLLFASDIGVLRAHSRARIGSAPSSPGALHPAPHEQNTPASSEQAPQTPQANGSAAAGSGLVHIESSTLYRLFLLSMEHDCSGPQVPLSDPLSISFRTFTQLVGCVALMSSTQHAVQVQLSEHAPMAGGSVLLHAASAVRWHSLLQGARTLMSGFVHDKVLPCARRVPAAIGSVLSPDLAKALWSEQPSRALGAGGSGFATPSNGLHTPASPSRRRRQRMGPQPMPFHTTRDLRDTLILLQRCMPGLTAIFVHFSTGGHALLDGIRDACGNSVGFDDAGSVASAAFSTITRGSRATAMRPLSAEYSSGLSSWVGWKRGHVDLGKLRRTFREIDENDDGLLTGSEVLRFIKSMVGVSSRQEAVGSIRGVGPVADRSWAVLVLRMAAADDKWASRSASKQRAPGASGLTLTFAQFVDAVVLLVNRQYGVLVAPQSKTPLPTGGSAPAASMTGGGSTPAQDRHANRTAARHALWREELFLIDSVGVFCSILVTKAQLVAQNAAIARGAVLSPEKQPQPSTPGQSSLSSALHAPPAVSSRHTDRSVASPDYPPSLKQALLDAEVDAVLSGADPEQVKAALVKAHFAEDQASEAPHASGVAPADDAASVVSLTPSHASLAPSALAGGYARRNALGVSPNGPRGRPSQRVSRRAASPLRSQRRQPLEVVLDMWLLPDGWVTLLRRMGVSQRSISRVDCLRIFDWSYRTQCAADAAGSAGGAPPSPRAAAVAGQPLGMGLRFPFFVGALAAVAVHLKGRHPHVVGGLPRCQCVALLLATLHVPPPSTGTELEHLVPIGTNAHALFPDAMQAIHWLSGLLPPMAPYTEAAVQQPAAVRHTAQYSDTEHVELSQHLLHKLGGDPIAEGASNPPLAAAELWQAVAAAVGVPAAATDAGAPLQAAPAANDAHHGNDGATQSPRRRFRRTAALAAALSPFSAARWSPGAQGRGTREQARTPAQQFLSARIRATSPAVYPIGAGNQQPSEAVQSPARYQVDLSQPS